MVPNQGGGKPTAKESSPTAAENKANRTVEEKPNSDSYLLRKFNSVLVVPTKRRERKNLPLKIKREVFNQMKEQLEDKHYKRKVERTEQQEPPRAELVKITLNNMKAQTSRGDCQEVLTTVVRGTQLLSL